MESDIRSDIGKRLAGITVYDPAGAAVRLADCWRDDPAVLVFVRHFG